MKRKILEFQYLWIDCDCHDHAHSITVSTLYEDEDDMPTEIDITMRLRYIHNIFRRVWYALLYVIGRPCRYGEYDAFCTSGKTKVTWLRDMCQRVIDSNEKKGWVTVPEHDLPLSIEMVQAEGKK